jgi:hypothetical protein
MNDDSIRINRNKKQSMKEVNHLIYFQKFIFFFLQEIRLEQNLLQVLSQQEELNSLINHLNQSKYKY